MRTIDTGGRAAPDRFTRDRGIAAPAPAARTPTVPTPLSAPTTAERLACGPTTAEALGAAPSPVSRFRGDRTGGAEAAPVPTDAPGPPVSPETVSARPVAAARSADAAAEAEAAAAAIRDNLEDGWFTEVTRGDLLENSEIVDALSLDATHELIDRLSDAELRKWFGEFHDGGLPFVEDGLTAAERGEFHDTLASRLTPAQLVRVHDALDGEDRRLELADAIARESGESTRVGVVARLADRVDDDPIQTDVGLSGATTRYWDADARGVATVLAGFDASEAEGLARALDTLSESRLDAVLRAATGRSSFQSTFSAGGMPSSPTVFSSPELLVDIVRDAAAIADADVKGRLFELAAPRIDDIRGEGGPFAPPVAGADADARAVADALTALLGSDTVGIVTSLESEGAATNSRAGNGLSAYTEELIRQGDTDTLSDIVVALQSGNDGTADPVAFLAESAGRIGNAENYQNAANLGYFVGAVREGVEAVNAGTEANAELLNTVFGVALSAINGGGVVKGVGGATVRAFVDEITAGIVDGRIELADGLEALAWPRINNSSIESAFDDAVDRVQRN